MQEEMEHAPPRQWPNVNVPPGYRFKPTPRELIQCYLEPWVATEPGHPSPGEFYGIMAAADVYGEDPGTLASRFKHVAHDDGNWYFLSVARWKDGHGNGGGSSSSSKQRMNRAVGALGTWHGSGKRIAVRGAGHRQSFEFRPAGGGKIVWLMEEFSTARDGAAARDGLRVLCRLHLRPKAAAEAAADGDERQQQQQQVEANDDVPAPCNKRQRTRAPPARQQVEHRHFDADYWTAAAPDVGFTSSHATAAAPAPPDVGCSYATTSSQAAAAAAPVTELTAEALATWQHQPMMEQAGDGGYQYDCATGVHGGVYIRADGEPQPLEIVTGDVEFTAEDFKLTGDSDFVFTVEHLMQLDDCWIMDSNSKSFSSFLQPKCDDGVQENNGPKPEPSDGVQENDDGDPKGDADGS